MDEEKEFGDFEEVVEEGKKENVPENNAGESFTRVRFPRKGQLIGIVIQRLGGNRMSVHSTDNKIRNCRVPGRFRRKFWIRPGNAVIIEPWEDDDNKGDILYQYRKNEFNQLKKRNMLKGIKEEF